MHRAARGIAVNLALPIGGRLDVAVGRISLATERDGAIDQPLICGELLVETGRGVGKRGAQHPQREHLRLVRHAKKRSSQACRIERGALGILNSRIAWQRRNGGQKLSRGRSGDP